MANLSLALPTNAGTCQAPSRPSCCSSQDTFPASVTAVTLPPRTATCYPPHAQMKLSRSVLPPHRRATLMTLIFLVATFRRDEIHA